MYVLIVVDGFVLVLFPCLFLFFHFSICISIRMYVCIVTHIARVWINRVRLPIAHVVLFSLSPFAPENLVSRDGFGSPVPRHSAHLHTQAESGAYTYGIPPEFRGGVHL